MRRRATRLPALVMPVSYLPIIHLVFSNLKTWLSGIHHGVGGYGPVPRAAYAAYVRSPMRYLARRRTERRDESRDKPRVSRFSHVKVLLKCRPLNSDAKRNTPAL